MQGNGNRDDLTNPSFSLDYTLASSGLRAFVISNECEESFSLLIEMHTKAPMYFPYIHNKKTTQLRQKEDALPAGAYFAGKQVLGDGCRHCR